MKIKLDALSFQKGDPWNMDNDVHVSFEYQRLETNDVKFYLDIFVGTSEEIFRFYLRIIEVVYMDELYHHDEQFVEAGLQALLPSLVELILILDDLVKKDVQERH